MELTTVRCIIATLCIFLLHLNDAYASEMSLYSPGDHILELDINNFNNNVYNQKKTFIIEFYSSWCGACIAYAPHFKTFASRVKNWSPILQVAAVNCGEDINSKLCREHGIEKFPTLKFFKYSPLSKDDGSFYNGDTHDVVNLPLELAGLVHEEWTKHQPSGWPNFDFIDDNTSLNQMWQQSGSAYLIVFIVGTFPAKLAWAEMINFVSDQRVRIYSATRNNLESQKLAADSGLPKVYYFKRDDTSPVYTFNYSPSYDEVSKKTVEYLGLEAQINGHESAVSSAAPVVQVTWSQFEVQMVDIMSAMHHMLQEEVPRKQLIKGERLEALKMWIRMLKKYAPGTTPIRRLFFRLDKWIHSQNNGITSERWTEEVNAIQSELGHPLPANMTWRACRGSKPFLRGYSCGLWTLMHVVTVSARNMENKNPSFDVLVEVVEPIHQFIWRFFSCETCAQHFHTYYTKTNLTALKKPDDGIIWLWRAHNIANEVLAKQPSDDPAFPKQQFPPISLCSSCWSNGKFVENEVVSFLINYYSDIRSDGLQPSAAYTLTEIQNGEVVQESAKRLNPKFAIGFESVDQMEQADARQRRQLDANSPRRWKDIDNIEYGRSYDPSSGIQTFYLLWIAIGIVAVVIVYMQYNRNRSKFWKIFYYYNDYKL